MRAVSRTTVICVLLVLAGCKLAFPQVTSATVERYQSGGTLQAVPLNSDQIHALSDWFSQHGSGWSSTVATYVPTLIVRAKHANGDISEINVLSGMVVVNNHSGQFQQHFSQTDLAAIRSILEDPLMANPALKFAPSGRWDAPSARPLAPR
ncbi:MAG TPA: hypothetical protein VIU93_01915 [Gallionellaceae bacterium]